MLIAQISDTHIMPPGKKAYGVVPVGEFLVRTIAHINACVPAVDAVLLTGDVTFSGRPEEAEEAARLMESLNCPYYIIPGNHDDRSCLRSAFDEKALPSGIQDFCNYVIEDFDVRLIAVDSTSPSKPGGEICQTRAKWLDERIAESKERPTVIFMHHPPVKCGVLETDMDGFVGAELLGDVIEKYNNIEAVVCGHIHLPVHVRWRGTVVSTALSMGMQLGLDLTLKRPSEFVLEAPGYQLHFWTPQKDLVTHTVYVRDVDGPYPFDEQT